MVWSSLLLRFKSLYAGFSIGTLELDPLKQVEGDYDLVELELTSEHKSGHPLSI